MQRWQTRPRVTKIDNRREVEYNGSAGNRQLKKVKKQII